MAASVENIGKLIKAKQMLYQQKIQGSHSIKLTSPKMKRDEIQEIKNHLNDYKYFKESQIFLGKRDRTIKGGWRHGITGVENAHSSNISEFYKEAKTQRDRLQNKKDVLNHTRLSCKLFHCFLLCFRTQNPIWNKQPVPSEQQQL